MSRNNASQLRQRICKLREARERIERILLQRRRMIRGSFIERFLGTTASKRTSPAYYLSFRRAGRTVLRYVAEGDRKKVQARTEAWSEYLRLVAEWVKLSRQLEESYRKLGQAQAEFPVKEGEEDV